MKDVISQTFTEDLARVIVLVVVVAGVTYMLATGQTVPPELWSLLGLVIGYYFGRGVTNGKSKPTD